MHLLLIVSAIKEELQELEFFHKKYFTLDNKKYEILVFPLGIGKLNAIISLFKWYFEVYKLHYKNVQSIEILFLGSCGSYTRMYKDFVYSNIFVNVDYAILNNKAKLLQEVCGEIQTHIGMFADHLLKQFNWQFGIINSTDSITLSKVDINSFKDKCHLHPFPFFENLEVYGVAKFCNEFNISFTCFLCVTNVINKRGSINWQKNYKVLSKKMNEIIKNYLISILD